MKKTIEIPEGYEARIEGNKVILEPKESEDERTRKEIIGFLDMINKDSLEARNFIADRYGDAIPDDMIPTWIAYLEKQGNKAFSVERVFAEAGIKPAYKDGNSWCVLIGENIQEGICGFGETPRHAYVNFLKELWNRAFQTPVRLKPEFKPKFKVGDFVLHGKKNIIFQVEKTFLDDTYRIVPVDTDKGKAVTSATEDTLRLWTIQDAKDGDVLSYRDGQWIFIYKEKIDDSSFYYHTLYSTIHQDLTINDAGFTLLGGATIPATKEQRNLLFQKMKESGYEWDTEKKELKMVEQNPAWSEEDEKMLNKCIEYASIIVPVKPTEESGLFVDFKRMPDEKAQDWLKALKDRYTWRPSEEQMKALEFAIGKYPLIGEVIAILGKLYKDLKKLTEH